MQQQAMVTEKLRNGSDDPRKLAATFGLPWGGDGRICI
jgi:hypothetical protein